MNYTVYSLSWATAIAADEFTQAYPDANLQGTAFNHTSIAVPHTGDPYNVAKVMQIAALLKFVLTPEYFKYRQHISYPSKEELLLHNPSYGRYIATLYEDL